MNGPPEFIGDRFGIRENNAIGRSDNCDIILPDPSVSASHAFLFWDRGDLILEPASREGRTKINGRLAIRKHALKTGDVISIGDVDFAVYIRRNRLYDN